MKKLVLATGNINKARELKKILPDYQIYTLADIGFEDEIEENADSFSGNALIKARLVSDFTDMAVIADDSGLCVDALGGEPGVYSARYAGENVSYEDNNNKLIEAMKDVPVLLRTAKFVCAAAVVFEDKSEYVCLGETFGSIALAPRGTGGFGYDPYFIVNETNLTYSQMSEDEKNSLSHRQKAFTALKKIISDHYKE